MKLSDGAGKGAGMRMLERFYLLDILRGLASLSVVIWHYSNFITAQGAPLVQGEQPFFQALHMFYEHGDRAVWLFFVLSGFVFFANYADSIGARQMRAGAFFILRFSRLYPLHLLTLLVVALGQSLSYLRDGSVIVYGNNDLYHFVLNLLFAMNWGLERGFSFNGPAWSISVEVVLYAVFFLLCAAIGRRRLPLFLIACIVVLVGYKLQATPGSLHIWEFSSGASYFFIGGLIYMIWDFIGRWPRHQWLFLAAAAVVTAAASYLAFRTPGHWLRFEPAIFGGLVGGLAVVQRLLANAGRPLRVVGDITYATYLVHFPVQLFAILAIRSLGLDVDFHAPLPLIAFVAAVIALGIPIYYGFELPAQRFLRKRLLRPPAAAPKHKDLGEGATAPASPAARGR